MTAIATIAADMRRMTKASAACRRLMTIPGVGQFTALAIVAAIDDPSRIRSRDVDAYLGLVPRRYQSGEVDYVGGISKCGDQRVRTLLYEAAVAAISKLWRARLSSVERRPMGRRSDWERKRDVNSLSRHSHFLKRWPKWDLIV
jgi:transposase